MLDSDVKRMQAVLIAGPTASGKSALALALAEVTGGVVINTDSMQVYRDLRVLTARPTPDEEARAPHRLYGYCDAAVNCSAGSWVADAATVLAEARAAARLPIFVGGTGLYFRALSEGISEMPEIPQQVRDRWRYELNERGAARLHRILMQEDAAAAMKLRASDGQRIVRALEVIEASGRSILSWQAERGMALIDRESAHFFVIEPDRAALVERIEARFDTMIERGALDEVRELVALDLDPALPAMKAIGVPELQAAMAGEIGFPLAIQRVKAATRQYAKRQATWFRHQLDERWRRIPPAQNFDLAL